MNQVLHHEPVAAAGRTPQSWLFILHGIYGSGRNWASLAKRLVQRRSDWGVILVDLRAHGKSQEFQPPHTLAAVATDLVQLTESIGYRPRAVLGHSFGGKVALAFGACQTIELDQTWVIDAAPQPTEPNGLAWEIVSMLRHFPSEYDERDQLVNQFHRAGVSRPVATWMAMNLQRVNDRFIWRVCLDTIEALLMDYFASDLWLATQEAAQRGTKIRFVKALQSDVIGDDVSRRILDLGHSTGRIHLHALPGGHMLNVDNPDGVVDLLSQHL